MGKAKTSRKSRPLSFGSSVALCVLSGVLVFMSFPNFLEVELFPLQWVSLIPLLFVLEGRTPRAGFLWGLWTGLIVNGGGFYWITHLIVDFGHMPLWVAIPICTLNALFQGLVFGFWSWGVVRLHHGFGLPLLLCGPLLFPVIEAFFPMVFPWYFANGQYLFYSIIQILDITGIPGLTWLLVLVNCGGYWVVKGALEGWKPRTVVWALPAIAFAAALVYGFIRIEQVEGWMEEAPRVKVGMVEANVGIFEKEAKGFGAKEAARMLEYNLVKHQRLSAKLEKEGVELLVWPESSYIPRWAAKVKTSGVEAIAVGANGSLFSRKEGKWVAPKTTSMPREMIRSELNGIWAGDENLVVGVGNDGMIAIYDGNEWRATRDVTSKHLYAVTGFNTGSGQRVVWAVGEGGEAVSGDAKAGFRRGVIGDGSTLRGISADATGKLVIAVGDEGQVVEITRRGWNVVETPSKGTLHGVFVADDKRAWAVGEEGVFQRGPSGGWTRITGAPTRLRAVWWDSGTDVLLVGGAGGLVARLEEGKWSTERTGGAAAVTSMGGDSLREVLAVRSDGSALERLGEKWTAVGVSGNAALRGVASIPFRAETYLPYEVSRFYQSESPLPIGTDAAAVAKEQEAVSRVDRMSPQRGFRLPVIFGIILFKGEGSDRRPYNSTLLLDEKGHVKGHYDKNHLLVFGEYIPGGDLFPKIYEWVPQASHFYAGSDVSVFPFRDFLLGPLVCYEDILPSFTRKVALRGVDALVNVTNDAWFGKTAEPYLHLALATYRSVENRKMMIRSTNTGVSAFIDPVGRIVAETSLEEAETLTWDVPMLREETIFTRFGNGFLGLAIVGVSLCFLYGYWPSGKRVARARSR